MSAAFERGHELCCEGCGHLFAAWQPLDSYNASAPEGSYCDAEYCMADEDVLRELEAKIRLSAEYIDGILRITPQPRHLEEYEYLFDVLAEVVERGCEDACVSSKVIHRELRMAAEAIMRHRLVAA
jgi:hypothetical protein